MIDDEKSACAFAKFPFPIFYIYKPALEFYIYGNCIALYYEKNRNKIIIYVVAFSQFQIIQIIIRIYTYNLYYIQITQKIIR